MWLILSPSSAYPTPVTSVLATFGSRLASQASDDRRPSQGFVTLVHDQTEELGMGSVVHGMVPFC